VELRELKDKACVVGVGATEQGRLPGLSGDDLAIQAFKRALDDAGLKKEDIDGLIVQPSYGGQGDVKMVGRRLGMEPVVAANIGHNGQSIQMAALLVSSGMCNYVACVYGTNQRSNRNRFAGSVYHFSGNFDQVYGLFNPGAMAALNYRRRMKDFGATEGQLGAIAVAQSKAAALNPRAVFREALTIEDYLNARYVIAPLRLVDFCMISDGGFCQIITTTERALDLKEPPVYISGMGAQASFLELEHPRAMYHPSQLPNARMVWETSGLGPADMDAVYIQEGYTPNVLAALENYGFCEFGTAHEWIQGGRIELGGELPVNVNGGQNRMTYTVGWQNTDDVVRQLRGEAEEAARQLPDPEVILCTYSTGLWQETWSVVYGR
jgi:acetyl-CoA acetyltransferase